MISIIKKFSRLLDRTQKKKVIILSFLMLAGACLESLGVSLMLPLVSAIMQPDIIETNPWIEKICRILEIHSYRDFVVLCIIALILIFIIKNMFLILQCYAQARFVEYSCAMKSHFRKFGNQMSGSGNHLYNYASLLA